MITRKQIVAEIKNSLKQYDQNSLLDYIAINNWIKEGIKNFGGNIMDTNQITLIVENGRAKLPDNFWALKVAVKCEQEGYCEENGGTEKHVQSVVSYLEYTEIDDYYNFIAGRPCKEDADSKYITETLIFETPSGSKPYSFFYKNPKILHLKRHTYKTRCTTDCINLGAESEFEISIDEKHNYISTNFNSGFITIVYRGLPCDNKGDLVVPETDRDSLKNYLLYNSIYRTLEMIWLGDDDPNLIQKIQYFKALSSEYFYKAKSDTVSKGAVGWATRLINNNRRNTNKYENMFRNL
jgi:hypothetical protein|tara:strand:- start:5669 stop:6553 length:885 start_codon:yes stop_codon:yes gene_type:complete